MKKIFFCCVFVLVFNFIFAQVSVDPTDRFYKHAQGWELKGYIQPLPLIRPYPNNVIRSVLEQVINSGIKKDAEIALAEYERIFGKSYSIYVTGAGEYKATENRTKDVKSGTKNVKGEMGIAGEVSFHPMVFLGYDLGMYAEVTDYSDIAPYYKNKAEDSIFDAVSVGPIDAYLDWNMNLSFGTQNAYVTAGISKTGYGSFLDDGLALNDTTFHSANIIFSLTRKKWSYASSFEILGASMNNPSAYDSLNDGKYLSFHVIKYRFNRYVELSYYENVIFGPKTNLAYLFPVPFMPVQNIGGANDNLQMGLFLQVRPVMGLEWATDIFVDDLEVNDIVKLNFDTKIRVAGQTGLIFSPADNACKRISLNYQMVLPYVYAHWDYKSDDSGYLDGKTVNYQNYTNAGVNIGSALDPNSDKVSFSASFEPTSFFRMNFRTNFIRHSNSAEAFGEDDAAEYVLAKSNQYTTDGSVHMHQMFSNEGSDFGKHVEQAWENLGFMTSDHKLGILQAGFDGEFDFPKTKHGLLTLFASYTFEYVRNSGVNSNVYKGLGYVKNSDTNFTFNGNTYASYDAMKDAAKDVAKNQKEDWIDALRDRVNHYITVGFRYTY
ncbi:hypothetical protein [Treponema pectinovorum]|uniref:hypothetical protein n=1 Tax=Treponema pectinovorum TaxID=164 RepID=UPI0011C92440|nr:hypothetical protein [Treponema pectinovorum]